MGSQVVVMALNLEHLLGYRMVLEVGIGAGIERWVLECCESKSRWSTTTGGHQHFDNFRSVYARGVPHRAIACLRR